MSNENRCWGFLVHLRTAEISFLQEGPADISVFSDRFISGNSSLMQKVWTELRTEPITQALTTCPKLLSRLKIPALKENHSLCWLWTLYFSHLAAQMALNLENLIVLALWFCPFVLKLVMKRRDLKFPLKSLHSVHSEWIKVRCNGVLKKH